MHVFIDAAGRYYQAPKAKDSGDAKIEHPTALMREYLTEKPVTMPEFGVGVREGEVKKLKVPETKTPEEGRDTTQKKKVVVEDDEY